MYLDLDYESDRHLHNVSGKSKAPPSLFQNVVLINEGGSRNVLPFVGHFALISLFLFRITHPGGSLLNPFVPIVNS